MNLSIMSRAASSGRGRHDPLPLFVLFLAENSRTKNQSPRPSQARSSRQETKGKAVAVSRPDRIMTLNRPGPLAKARSGQDQVR